MRILIALSTLFCYGFQSTQNTGMGKLDRINLNEKRLMQLNSQLKASQTNLKKLEERMGELEKQIDQLKASSKTIVVD